MSILKIVEGIIQDRLPGIYFFDDISAAKFGIERDETVNYNISECSKMEQNEYKIKHDWVGEEIYMVLRKKFKFNHIIKWYMYKTEPSPRVFVLKWTK